ncbi:hypothetical protein AMTR_s00093p00155340 [Amborella trichopoda]|uniref:Uncharacterized protein n=1 Tax=Amborella trichopoda TaxID=13333 RepID=W1NSW5_AMBTC|nr:hypothetical protein AMTR_s00093p00155340 [Amborella trichopoda]
MGVEGSPKIQPSTSTDLVALAPSSWIPKVRPRSTWSNRLKDLLRDLTNWGSAAVFNGIATPKVLDTRIASL